MGDNIFYGYGLQKKLHHANALLDQATVFAYRVHDPERYGVAEFDADGKVISIEEKPKQAKSNYAITGLYFYDDNAPYYAKQIKPSSRGELEITNLNNIYLQAGLLNLERMHRGYAWLDTGTHEGLIDAHQFVQTIEQRQGIKIACPEALAFEQQWIDAEQLERLAPTYSKALW